MYDKSIATKCLFDIIFDNNINYTLLIAQPSNTHIIIAILSICEL